MKHLITPPHHTSRHTPRHSPARLGPLVLGAFFAAVTARVLFDDIVTGSAPWHAAITTAHVLTLAALVGAIASGHYFLGAVRDRAVVAACGLAVLFVAATAYVVTASGARNAEVAATKASAATDAAHRRSTAVKARDEAKRKLDAAEIYHTAQRDAAAKECATGKRGKCEGANATRDDARELVTLRANTLQLEQAALDLLPTTAAPHAGYAHAARVLAALGLGEARVIEDRLILIMPFAVVLISELGTIVFLGMGLPAHRRAPRAFTLPNPDEIEPADLDDAKRLLTSPVSYAQPVTASNVVAHPVLAALKAAGRPLSNDELAAAMRVTKGEASKRRREVAPLIAERRDGRHVRVMLNTGA